MQVTKWNITLDGDIYLFSIFHTEQLKSKSFFQVLKIKVTSTIQVAILLTEFVPFAGIIYFFFFLKLFSSVKCKFDLLHTSGSSCCALDRPINIKKP